MNIYENCTEEGAQSPREDDCLPAIAAAAGRERTLSRTQGHSLNRDVCGALTPRFTIYHSNLTPPERTAWRTEKCCCSLHVIISWTHKYKQSPTERVKSLLSAKNGNYAKRKMFLDSNHRRLTWNYKSCWLKRCVANTKALVSWMGAALLLSPDRSENGCILGCAEHICVMLHSEALPCPALCPPVPAPPCSLWTVSPWQQAEGVWWWSPLGSPSWKT